MALQIEAIQVGEQVEARKTKRCLILMCNLEDPIRR